MGLAIVPMASTIANKSSSVAWKDYVSNINIYYIVFYIVISTACRDSSAFHSAL